MFTGIIEGLGTITGIRPSSRLKHLSLDADFDLDQTKIGDSIAVDGACLTAVEVDKKHFEVDVSAEGCPSCPGPPVPWLLGPTCPGPPG